MDFFTKDEILYLDKYAGKPYDKATQRNIGDEIRNTLWEKTKYWAKKTVEHLDGFDMHCRANWHKQAGYGAGFVFRPYTWAQIYKQGDKGKHIFFTVGVETLKTGTKINGLRCKLDYLWFDNHLTDRQKKIADALILDDIKWMNDPPSISVDRLHEFCWDDLITQTVTYINCYLPIYEKVVAAVWGDVGGRILNVISASSISIKKPEKKGSSLIDRDKFKAKRDAQEVLGLQGEKLVVKWEKDFLREQGKADLVDEVQVLGTDGDGYDVISRFPDGRKKFIEVKTTSGPSSTCFFLSDNERRVAKKTGSQYQIYRLYDYCKKTGNARCIIFENPEKQLLLIPSDFKVYTVSEDDNSGVDFWNNDWD